GKGFVGSVNEVGKVLCTTEVQGMLGRRSTVTKGEFGGLIGCRKMPFDLAFDVDLQSLNTRQSTPEFSGPAFDEAVQWAVIALLLGLNAQITNELYHNGAGSNAFKQAKEGEAYVATLSWKDFREAFFLQYFLRSEQQKYEREYHTIRQKDGELTGEFMKRFLRLAGFVEKKAGPLEEQAKHFKWALSDWILDGIVNTEFTDVAQVANAGRNIKLLCERGGRGNDGRNYDRQGGNSSHRFYQRNRDQQYNRSYGSSRQKKYTNYTSPPLCDTCGKPHPGKECYRVTGACFSCGLTGHKAKDCPKNNRGNQNDKRPDVKRKVYSLTRGQVANSSGTVTRTLFMNGRAVFVLFDTGATHFVISVLLSKYINIPHTLLNYTLSISTPMRSLVVINREYQNCPLQFDSVISGDLDKLEFVYQDSQLGLLTSLMDTSSDGPSLETRLIVRDFSDVFPEELPGIQPEREVKFGIELIPGTQPISKAPYCMAPIKLKELKEQLQELIDLRFIRPSVSSWVLPFCL
nr:hypothetical protein [Tanacetum cinerariifolium]